MKKIVYCVKRLVKEFKGMRKPDRKTLFTDTARIVGISVGAAVILKIVDTGFAAFLGLML